MAINLDHVTEQITVTDTAANADLNINAKGSGNIIITPQSANAVGLIIAAPSNSTANAGRLFFDSTGGVSAIANIGGNQLSFRTAATIGSSSGSIQALVSHTASAVNYVQATGAATGSGPTISAQGSDTNADLNATSKGTGVVNLNTGAGTQVRIIDSGGTAVNRIHLQGQATGFLPVIASRGSDTNLGMSYSTQGTGAHDFYTAGTSFTQQLKVAHTASAVNYVQVQGNSTTNSPIVSVQGSDANIGLVVSSKGTARIGFFTNNVSTQQFVINHTGSAVNYLQVVGGATGSAPVLSALGSDTNIPLVLQPKGTGALQAQLTDSTATGGNARGANAVDWQTSRDTAGRVASGSFSIVGGGSGSSATTSYAAVLSGLGNTSSGVVNVIAGGFGNVGSGIYSAIVGGGNNTSAGWYNFIGAGSTNSGTSGSAVTTQSGTMNATTAVTLSGSNANIKVGQLITGTSIGGDTYVSAISGTSLTLSKVASGSSTSTLSFFTPHGVVVGGGNNTATGSYSFIGGGGDAGTAGNRNVASGAWSVVVGGIRNTASGDASFVGGGGIFAGTSIFPNTASGNSAVVVGGINNQSTATISFVGAGYNNIASGIASSILSGSGGLTRGITAYTVFASDSPISGTQGTSQAGLLVLGKQTTDATPTVLVSNQSAVGNNNQVIMPNNSAYFFTGEVVAGVTGGGNTKGWTIEGVIKRGANAASTALVGTPTVTSTYADAGASTWVIAVTADTTNGGLAVTFTGQASTTIRTVAKISTVEMTY